MSDLVVQSDDDNDGKSGQSLHFYQSVWMAHWMHTSCKPGSKVHDPLSLECQYREDGDSKQLGPSKISNSAKEIGEFSESRTVNIMNENLKLSSAILGKERLESQCFPKFNISQNMDTVIALRNDASGNKEVSEMGTLSGGCHFQHEGILGNLEHQVKSLDSLEKKSLAVSTTFQHDVGSSSKIVPYGNNTDKSPVHSFMWEQEEPNQLSHFVTGKEHCTNTKFQSYSTPLVTEKKMNGPLDFRRSGTSSSRQNNRPLLLRDPLASNDQVPVFVGERCEDLQNHCGTRSFPNWSSPLDMTKSETLFHDFCSVPRIPCSFRDVDTMRICATVDSMEELSGRPAALSQMTHHFLVTKRAGVNLSEGSQVLRDSTFSTNLKGKLVNKFLSLSPDFGLHGQQGVKLQPLGSSMDSEGKENLRETWSSAFCLKNESSAETETMEMDVFNQDNFSGVVSSPANKNTKVDQMSSTSQAAVASSREETGGRFPNTELPDMNDENPAVPAVTSSREETGGRFPNTELPDMNDDNPAVPAVTSSREKTGGRFPNPELPDMNDDNPAVPAVTSLADDRETSTSRTESLDVDHLLSHAELPRNSKSICFQDDHVELESCSRWVKRLKSALGSFALGTRSSRMEEASSHEKIGKVFSKIMTCSMTNSEPTMGKCPNKEPMAVYQTAALLRNDKSSSTETVRKTQDVTRFNPWIRRWCHRRDASSTQNHEALVVYKPQSSSATLEEFRKKQFPSIAAMALMGRALSSFQPCEFRKKGTYIVWKS